MGDPVLIAALIALAVSLNYGFGNHVQHIGTDYMDARTGTLINVATTTVVLWFLAPLFLVPADLATPPVVYFALAGLIVPAVSISLTTMSVGRIGPGLTAGLAATSPVFAMTVALLFLDETVTWPIAVGTATVIGGVMMIAFRGRIGANWPLWALALPLGAALTRGISHPLIKTGLEGLPSPLTAALVSATVSLVVLAGLHFGAGRRLPPWNPGYPWFALAGILNGNGIVGLAVALGMGDVVVVSPIVATTPAFTLLLGYLMFRREVITWWSVAAIAVIFGGVMLVLRG